MGKRKIASDPGNAAFRLQMSALVKLFGSATRLGKLAGVSTASINAYLKGSEPNRSILCALADVGKMSVDRLARGTEHFSNDADFVNVPMVSAQPGNGWCEGDVLAKFHRALVKERFNRADPNNLVLVEASDRLMQPFIHRGELLVVDRSHKGPGDGFYALVIDSAIRVRSVSRIKDQVIVSNRQKRDGRAVYSQSEFQRDVNVIGMVVLSGHYPEINDHNED